MHIGTLHPHPPYDFARLLEFLAHHPTQIMDIAHDGAFWRVIRQGPSLALVRVSSSGTTDQPALDVHLEASSGDIDRAQLMHQIGRILAVDVDHARFFDLARQNAALWQAIEPVYGLPRLRTADAFEALVTTIIEQHIAWKSALRYQRLLLEWHNTSLSVNDVAFHAFPEPGVLATADAEELKLLKITNGRIALLIGIGQAIVSGELALAAIADAAPEEAYKMLCAIKGIGHWTAAVTLARTRGETAYVAHHDVALQAAVNRYFYGQTGRVSPQTLMDLFSAFGDDAGTAAFYVLARWVLEEY